MTADYADSTDEKLRSEDQRMLCSCDCGGRDTLFHPNSHSVISSGAEGAVEKSLDSSVL